MTLVRSEAFAQTQAISASADTSVCRRSAGGITGVVRDTARAPVAFANISVDGRSGSVAIADRSGCFALPATLNGLRTIQVRRIGYRERRDSLVLRGDTSMFLDIRMTPIATSLASTEITAQRERALIITGFYDRLTQRKNGLGDAWFVTPEDINQQHLNHVTSFLLAFPSIRLAQSPFGTRPMIPMGNGGHCIMNVYIDGVRLRYDPYEGIDELVPVLSLLAIEVYPNLELAPPQFQSQNMDAGSPDRTCGVILIWTKG